MDLPVFLQQKLKAKKGDIIEIPKDIDVPLFSNSYPDEGASDEKLSEMTNPVFFSSSDGDKAGDHS